MGQEEPFPPPRLSAGFGFSKKTLAGTRGNEQDAPKADAATPTIGEYREGPSPS
jgi:hypothetical protein